MGTLSIWTPGRLLASVAFVLGTGGSGLWWASPIRSRVRVSWLLVGTPRRMLLEKVSKISWSWNWKYLLLWLKHLHPARELFVEKFEAW
jgi:hypothetical protein